MSAKSGSENGRRQASRYRRCQPPGGTYNGWQGSLPRARPGVEAMGMPPTGEIVARVMLARACGCLQEFQHYKVDKYRGERQAKFQRTRCPACAAQLVKEQ